jgi:hypothetical protein
MCSVRSWPCHGWQPLYCFTGSRLLQEQAYRPAGTQPANGLRSDAEAVGSYLMLLKQLVEAGERLKRPYVVFLTP